MSLAFVSCGKATTEDEYVRVAISKTSYSSYEEIWFEITFKEWVVWGSHCSIWFEEKINQAWQKVGECRPPNYEAESWPIGDGEQVQFTMPAVSPENSYYTYSLSPGIYRLAIVYSSGNRSVTSYSPEFKLEP